MDLALMADSDLNGRLWDITRKKVKSFPSYQAHRAALISVSLAHSQTPAYTAIRG